MRPRNVLLQNGIETAGVITFLVVFNRLAPLTCIAAVVAVTLGWKFRNAKVLEHEWWSTHALSPEWFPLDTAWQSFLCVVYCHRRDVDILGVNNSLVSVPKVQRCCGLGRPCCSTSISSPRDHFCSGTSPTPTSIRRVAKGPLQMLREPLPSAQTSHCFALPPRDPTSSPGGLREPLLLWSSTHLAKPAQCTRWFYTHECCEQLGGAGGEGRYLYAVAHMRF